MRRQSKVIVLWGKCTTIIQLKEHISKMTPVDILLYPVQPSSEKPLLAAGGNYYRDPQLNNSQRGRDSGALGPKGNVLTSPPPKAQRSTWKMRQKGCKSQRSWMISSKLLSRHSRTDTHVNSQRLGQHTQDLHREVEMDTNQELFAIGTCWERKT